MSVKVTRPVGFFLVLTLGLSAEEPTRKELRDAAGALVLAQREGDLTAFLEQFSIVIRSERTRDLRAALSAYAELMDHEVAELAPGAHIAFHSKTASAVRGVSAPKMVDELRRLQSRADEWRVRLLLLDAAGYHEELDLLASSLRALEDPHPVVVRRALRYLSRARTLEVVDAIIERAIAFTAESRSRIDPSELARTRLAFRSALTQLLHVDLPAPEDYKNYLATRRDSEDLFEPKEDTSERTEVTLFGAAVSGKNIVFVFDVSGSMLTTDPPPPGAPKSPERGRTVVGRPDAEPEPRVPEERRRITRAKKELARVVRALPSDVRFNIIFYSSGVDPWQRELVPASESNKQTAVEFVEKAKAEGITVTDLALEEAFADLSVDTVYLVTDGAPTHIGSTGPAEPQDAEQIIENIHRRMRELNFLRDVRIFTLGFHGAKEDFLEKLAADHGGRYVAIQ